ncbi:MAG TPA: hypothetical protein VFW82_08120, partial [Dyella sp.]|nr:hypothetical protein [Dyella sp.]
MGERTPRADQAHRTGPHGIRGWLAIGLFALIALFTLASLFASRRERPRMPAPAPAPATQPVLPTVQLWLSTADRRLQLARQPDIAMAP